jgi:tryptophan halogenase
MIETPLESHTDAAIKRVVIVGGGTSGWMCAAALARIVPQSVEVTLVESDEIGVIGVGEATIPTLMTFNSFLGLDENDFIRQTQGTFKLGIEFVDWDRLGQRYFHPFGFHGHETAEFKFHQLWLKLRHAAGGDEGRLAEAGEIGDYNLCTVAARHGRFTRPRGGPESILSSMRYAFHFDASLYGKYLRAYAEKRGVRRVEGMIVDVQQRADDGFIESVALRDGRVIEGDLFVDCSGFRGLLIEQTLHAGYIDWGRYLPCDRALAVPCELAEAPVPYTRSTADAAGWRWRIPLQHRMGNGYVYCSDHIEDDDACGRLLAKLEGRPLGDPRPIRFRTGHRVRFWVKNCIAIGLSGGFIEPLESTSIHLVQMGIARLILLWPDKGFDRADIDEYNRSNTLEYEQLRDFIVLHYKATRRDDTAFWRRCAEMAVPDTLAHKMELFRAKGRIFRYQEDLFTEDSWLAVMLGQGVTPRSYDRLVDRIPLDDLVRNMALLKDATLKTALAMPTHQAFIDQTCRAPTSTINGDA